MKNNIVNYFSEKMNKVEDFTALEVKQKRLDTRYTIYIKFQKRQMYK